MRIKTYNMWLGVLGGFSVGTGLAGVMVGIAAGVLPIMGLALSLVAATGGALAVFFACRAETSNDAS